MTDSARRVQSIWRALLHRLGIRRVTTIVYDGAGVWVFDRALTPDEVTRQYEAWKDTPDV